MWLYIPSLESDSVPESAGSILGSSSPSSTLDSTIELFVSVSGTASRRRSSWHGWKIRPWSQQLFATASKILALSSEELMCLQRGFLANLGVLPEAAKEPQTTGGFGPISFGSSAVWSRDSSCWKTSLAYLPGMEPESDQCSIRLPNSGSMRNGRLSKRQKLELRTSGNAGFAWPTVRSHEVGEYQNQTDGTTQPTLTGAAMNWPTPSSVLIEPKSTVTKLSGRTPQCPQIGLADVVSKWPTPHGLQGGNGPDGNEFSTAVRKWQTPNSRDSEGNGFRGQDRTEEAKLSGQAKLWSTPAASDDKRGTTPYSQTEIDRPQGKPMTLGKDVACWATPSARDHKSGEASEETLLKNSRPLSETALQFSLPVQATLRHGNESSPNNLGSHPPLEKKRLNPNFVEWLMGAPTGWTIPVQTVFVAAEMESWYSKLRRLLSDLCGE